MNGQALSGFGIIPVRTSSAGNLALSGGWDLPKRKGEAFYDWPEQDGVEPYVGEEDLDFAGREITFNGLCRGTDHDDLIRKLGDFRQFIDGLPNGAVELACKWGTWRVNVSRAAEITVTGYRKQDATVKLSFTEPEPRLGGGVLPEPEPHNGGVDGYSWRSLGLGLTLSAGRYTTGTWKQLNVTEAPGQPVVVRGGLNKREITLTGYLTGETYEVFNNRLKVLYGLFGGAGIRRIVSGGTPFNCFCVDGFRVSGIRVKPGITLGLFSVKLIVV